MMSLESELHYWRPSGKFWTNQSSLDCNLKTKLWHLKNNQISSAISLSKRYNTISQRLINWGIICHVTPLTGRYRSFTLKRLDFLLRALSSSEYFPEKLRKLTSILRSSPTSSRMKDLHKFLGKLISLKPSFFLHSFLSLTFLFLFIAHCVTFPLIVRFLIIIICITIWSVGLDQTAKWLNKERATGVRWPAGAGTIFIGITSR
jgi:hypothetical protein